MPLKMSAIFQLIRSIGSSFLGRKETNNNGQNNGLILRTIAASRSDLGTYLQSPHQAQQE
jgi:hypothetical protein